MEISMAQFADAVDLATAVHWKQRRKTGEPYILHPMRVSFALRNAGWDLRYQAAGVLHDVVEDCDGMTVELLQQRYGIEVSMAVDAVTRRDGESYLDFIARASEHPIGKWVKYYDLEDNLGRIDELYEHRQLQSKLMMRYTKALVFMHDRGVRA